MISAMTTSMLLFVILTLVIAAYGLYTYWAVRKDGYGFHRRPPASHHPDPFDPSNRRLA